MNILILSSALLAASAGSQQSALLPWSAEQKAAAIAGCRYSIMSHALHDYTARHNLPGKQLPVNFVAPPAAEPYLVLCDCVIQNISSEISPNEFSAPTPAVQAHMMQLVSGGGVCAPKTGT